MQIYAACNNKKVRTSPLFQSAEAYVFMQFQASDVQNIPGNLRVKVSKMFFNCLVTAVDTEYDLCILHW